MKLVIQKIQIKLIVVEKMFQPIQIFFLESSRHSLFKNLLYTYRLDIAKGIILTIIFASLGLMIPEAIKQIIQFLKDFHVDSKDIRAAQYITLKYAVLQLFRGAFYFWIKQLFNELAIKIESSLAIKLVEKSLKMKKQYRSIWHQSKVFSFENIHLKLIHKLFQNLYLIIEIPFTILIAIGWLFQTSFTYGVIGSYWFTFAFLIQRSLDDKMLECNAKKWNLIEKRSNFNYQFMEKILFSRLTQEGSLIVEKNNDFFIEENHDHTQFYWYSSLYDITQILLPIVIIISIAIYDYNEANPFTVQQVFVILSLLGICFKPMKNYRKININFNDGFKSLQTIKRFFDMPQQSQSLTRSTAPMDSIFIRKNTIAEYSTIHQVSKKNNEQATNLYSVYKFALQINHQIEVNKGERLVVLGRKGQGSSMFLNLLVGELNIKAGQLQIGSEIAYLSQEYFFCHGTIAENLIFYNKNCDLKLVDQVYRGLRLDSDFKFTNGLNQMFSYHKFTNCQLKLILLGRIFCTNADIYILDCPFDQLDLQSVSLVNSMLRQKQAEGKTIILTAKYHSFQGSHPNTYHSLFSPKDKILIIKQAKTIQYGLFEALLQKPHSELKKFIHSQQSNIEMNHFNSIHQIAQKFQQKVKRAMIWMTLTKKQSELSEKRSQFSNLLRVICKYSEQVKMERQQEKKVQKIQIASNNYKYFLRRFLQFVPFRESLLIVAIIIAAESLHIFIHYFIGHQYKHHLKEGLSSLKILMIYELALTIGLCAVVFLEGKVSSALTVVKSNKLYKKSLQQFSKLDLEWYRQRYEMKLANLFNHDFEQIFVIDHYLLEIWKNVVVLAITILFISSNRYMMLFLTITVAILYYLIRILFKDCFELIIKNHSIFKYEFVKILHQSIHGASIFHAFRVTHSVISKAKDKYIAWADYKRATSLSKQKQNFLCEVVGILIGVMALEYGIKSKTIAKSDEGLIVTSILLLMNLSDVLKTLVNMSIKVEIFFRINILPIMEIVTVEKKALQKESQKQGQINLNSISGRGTSIKYDIHLNHLTLHSSLSDTPIHPFNLQLKEGSRVILFEKNQKLREELLKSLTNNLKHLQLQLTSTIFIGGRKITQFTDQQLSRLVGVIAWNNFYFSGTLRENLSWGNLHFHQDEALKFCQLLNISKDIANFSENKLNSYLPPSLDENQLNLTIKIAVLKILLKKPKIVVIYQTPSFFEKYSLIQVLDQYIPHCTIIKISNQVEEIFEMDRIIMSDNLKIVEDGNPRQFQSDELSQVGERLRESSQSAYQYLNKVSISPKFKQPTQTNPSQNIANSIKKSINHFILQSISRKF